MHYLAQQYLDLSFEKNSDSVAIQEHNGTALTYADLYFQSNRLANVLLRLGIRRQSRIAICVPRSAQAVVAMLGVLKADAIYVPLYDKSPRERTRRIMDDCAPDAVICSEKTVGQVQKTVEPTCPPLFVLLGGAGDEVRQRILGRFVSQEQIDQASAAHPEYKNIDTDIAYILYTSGSTGTPKGVMISHQNLINYIEWATTYFDIKSGDRILGTAPLHFDMSTFDVYCPMKLGATLCLATEQDILFPPQLVRCIEDEKITLWKGVSSLLMYLASAGGLQPGRMSSLQRIVFGGEKLPTTYLIDWMRNHPGATFYHAYGPTEATGISTCHRLTEIPAGAACEISIGRACANSEIILLRDDDRLAEQGEVGEICIRGACLSRGYWNDPERTQSTFIPNPVSSIPGDRIYRTGDRAYRDPQGRLYFVGRKDEQVKYQGYRIELGEIAHALQALSGVKDAVVLLLQSPKNGNEELVAFWEATKHGTASMSELRDILPTYMLPKRVVQVEAIPRTDRGKVDRATLQRVFLAKEAEDKRRAYEPSQDS